MKLIIANLKNFTLSHDIIIMDENNNAQYKQISSMKNMAENIVEQCYKNDTTKVKLIGNKNIQQISVRTPSASYR